MEMTKIWNSGYFSYLGIFTYLTFKTSMYSKSHDIMFPKTKKNLAPIAVDQSVAWASSHKLKPGGFLVRAHAWDAGQTWVGGVREATY